MKQAYFNAAFTSSRAQFLATRQIEEESPQHAEGAGFPAVRTSNKWRVSFDRLLHHLCGTGSVVEGHQHHAQVQSRPQAWQAQKESLQSHDVVLPVRPLERDTLHVEPYFSTPRSSTHQHVERCELGANTSSWLLPGQSNHIVEESHHPASLSSTSERSSSCCCARDSGTSDCDTDHDWAQSLLPQALIYLQLQPNEAHTKPSRSLSVKKNSHSSLDSLLGRELTSFNTPPQGKYSRSYTNPTDLIASSESVSPEKAGSDVKHIKLSAALYKEEDKAGLRQKWQRQQNWLDKHGRSECTLIYPEAMVQHAQRSRSLQMRFGQEPHKLSNRHTREKQTTGNNAEARKVHVFRKLASF